MIDDIRELFFRYGWKVMLKLIFLFVIIAATTIVFAYELMNIK